MKRANPNTLALTPELLTYPPFKMSGFPGQVPWAETA